MHKKYKYTVAKILEEDWYYRAQCRGTDSSLFFGDDNENNRSAPARIRMAQAICAECSVQIECLEFAISTGQTEGVWGGVSDKARKKIVRDRSKEN